MTEYIEREALMEDCKRMIDEMWNSKTAPVSWSHAYAEFLDNVERAPAADVAPVIFARWKYYHKQNIAVCTHCSFERDLDVDFGRAVACPNCGARMDGDSDAAD